MKRSENSLRIKRVPADGWISTSEGWRGGSEGWEEAPAVHWDAH